MSGTELRQLISKIEYDICKNLPDGISDNELNYIYISIVADLSNKLRKWADGNK